MIAARNNDRSGELPPRMKLHTAHLVLRKISIALRVRISPSMGTHGPYVAIDDVAPEEVLAIARILGD